MVNVDLALPPPEAVVGRVCPAAAEVTHGLLVGRVLGPDDGAVVRGASVRVVWMQDEAVGARWLEMVTDSTGTYRVCVPRGAPLSVEVTADSLPFTAVPAMFGETALRIVDVELRRPQ